MCAAGKAFTLNSRSTTRQIMRLERTLLLGFVVQVLLIASVFVYVENKMTTASWCNPLQERQTNKPPVVRAGNNLWQADEAVRGSRPLRP